MTVFTITLNPAIDKSAKVDGVHPEQKLRCYDINHEPGGGGINVSRILQRLDIHSKCLFTAGGDNGKLLEALVRKEHIDVYPITTAVSTRENLSVYDTLTKQQYRFGMPGENISDEAIDKVLEYLKQQVAVGDMVVISGSLAPGMSTRVYDTIVNVVAEKKGKIVADTSGEALNQIVKQPIFMIKPNQKELAMLAGKSFLSTKEQESFAKHLIDTSHLEVIAVSMGARGAFLASRDGIIYQSTPSVPVLSTVGAGDSMLAGLIYGIVHNLSLNETLKYGVACGTATTMSEGTNLASRATIDKTLNLLR